ncbi:MAG: MarR family transcriptional regulator [Bacteroidota bacterium]|nr:MarR family transcriptional regulator [Bacteroidota bacterium]
MPPSPRKKKSSVSTGFLLWQACNAWQRKIKSALDPVGITHVQFLLLDALNHLGGLKHPVSQVTLARVAGTDVMMTSKVIRLLEKKKLVNRKVSKTDARIFLLGMTGEGLSSLSKAKKLVAKTEDKLFSKLKLKHAKLARCLEEITED